MDFTQSTSVVALKNSLFQEGCQSTDKVLLVYVFHCDTWHLEEKYK